MYARFDDLRPGHEAGWELARPLRAIAAHDLDGVADALAAAEVAAAVGHWVAGFVSYDAAAAFDPAFVVRVGGADRRVPLAWFGVFGERRAVAPAQSDPTGGAYRTGPWTVADDARHHAAAVASVRRRIAAGDVYQVNITTRFDASFTGDASAFYGDLASAQRGAYHAYVDTGDHQIVSASPELFVERTGDRLVTRPMKGTAPRGRWAADDEARAAALLASPKERAENVMVTDMLRNDVGRVAAVGSVTVEELCGLERFDTVWQLTTTIAARLRPGTALVDVFAALFPCGSVTGAPKVAAMAAIAALESTARGVYCGAVGYLAPPGEEPSARFAVAIRTAVVDRARGTVTYGSGGGITWDSSAAAEYDELVLKAEVLTRRRPGFDLLETMVARRGRIALLDGHFDRLGASARYFAYPFDRTALDATVAAAVAGTVGAHRVRLRLAADGTPTIEVTPLAAPTPAPVRLAVDDVPVARADVFRYHKTTHRAAYEEARRRHPDADDVVLVDERGHLVETSIAALAVRLGGRWWTPPLASGALPGVARRAAIERGWLHERELTRADLAIAEAVAVGNAVRGVADGHGGHQWVTGGAGKDAVGSLVVVGRPSMCQRFVGDAVLGRIDALVSGGYRA